MQTSRETCTYKEKTTTGVTTQRNNVAQCGSAVSGFLDDVFWAAVESDGMKMLQSISPLKSCQEQSRKCQSKKRRRKQNWHGHSVTTPCTDSQLTDARGEAGCPEQEHINSERKTKRKHRTKRKLHSAFSNYLDCNDRLNAEAGENAKDISYESNSMDITETSTEEPQPKVSRSETVVFNKTSKLAKHEAGNLGKDQQRLSKEDPHKYTRKQERQTKMSPENHGTGNVSTAKPKSPNFQTSLEDSLNSSEQSQNRSLCKTVRGDTVNSLRVKRVKSRIAMFEAKRRKHISEKQKLTESTKETEQKTSPTNPCKRDAIKNRTPTSEALEHPHKKYLSASQPITSTCTPIGWHIRPLDMQSLSCGLPRRASCARRPRVNALITKFEESAKRRNQSKQEKLSSANHQNGSPGLMTDVNIPRKLSLGGSPNEAALESSPAELQNWESAHKKTRRSEEETNESDVNSSSLSISSSTSNRSGIKTSTNKRFRVDFACCTVCRCRCKHARPTTFSKAVQVSPSELGLVAEEQNRTASLRSEDLFLKEQSAQTECYETRKACQTAEISPYVVKQCDEASSPEKHGGDSNLVLKHVEIPLKSNCSSEDICQTLHIKKYSSLLRRSMSKEKEMHSPSSKSDNTTDTDSQRSLNTMSSLLLSPTLSPVAKTSRSLPWGPIKFTPKSRRHSDNLRQLNQQDRLFPSEDETDYEVIEARRASHEFLCKMDDDDRGEDDIGLVSCVIVTSQDNDKGSRTSGSIVRGGRDIGGKCNDKGVNNNDNSVNENDDSKSNSSDSVIERNSDKESHSSGNIVGGDRDKVAHSSDIDTKDSDTDADNDANVICDDGDSESGGSDSIFEKDSDKLPLDNNRKSESNDSVIGYDSECDSTDHVIGKRHGKANRMVDSEDDLFNNGANLAVQTSNSYITTSRSRKTPKLNDGLLMGLLKKKKHKKDKSKPKDKSKASKTGKMSSKTEKSSRRKHFKQLEVKMQKRPAKRNSKLDNNDKVANNDNIVADENDKKSSSSDSIIERDRAKVAAGINSVNDKYNDQEPGSSDTIINNDSEVESSDCIVSKKHGKTKSNSIVDSEDDLFDNPDKDDFDDTIDQQDCYQNGVRNETDLDNSDTIESDTGGGNHQHMRQHNQDKVKDPYRKRNNVAKNDVDKVNSYIISDYNEELYSNNTSDKEDAVDDDSGDIDGEIDRQVDDQSSESDVNDGVNESATGAVNHKHRGDRREISNDDIITSDEGASSEDFQDFSVPRTNGHRDKRAANAAVQTSNRKSLKLNDGLLMGLRSKTKHKNRKSKSEDKSKVSKSGKTSSKSGKMSFKSRKRQRKRPLELLEVETQEELAQMNRDVCQSMVSPFPVKWEDPLIKRVRADYDGFLQRHFRKVLTELGKERRLSDEPIKRGLGIKEISRERHQENKSTRKLAKKVKADGWIDYEILPQIYIEPNTESFLQEIK